MDIGNVELPIVSEITRISEAEVDEIKPLKSYGNEIDNVPVKHESSVQSLVIVGFINPETHSEHLSLDDQKRELKTLRRKDKFDNPFVYDGFKGYLLVENVDFDDSGDSRIVKEVEVEGRYFPWPKYYPESEP